MRSRITLLASVALGVSLPAVAMATHTRGHTGESEKADGRPDLVAVYRAIMPFVEGATLKDVDRTEAHGRTFFEITIQRDDGDFDVTVDGAGQIISTERDVPLHNIPLTARFAIEDAAKNADVDRVEEIVFGSRVFYEAEIETPSGERELTVAADGSVVVDELEVELASLPEAARTTIEQQLGAAPGELEVQKVEHAGLTFFEATKQVEGEDEQKVYVAEDGSIVDNPHPGLE